MNAKFGSLRQMKYHATHSGLQAVTHTSRQVNIFCSVVYAPFIGELLAASFITSLQPTDVSSPKPCFQLATHTMHATCTMDEVAAAACTLCILCGKSEMSHDATLTQRKHDKVHNLG